jgi:LmbE family N-acetylglucosaminyl deacetylase
VRSALAVVLALTIGAAGTGAGQLAPPGTGGVAALVNDLRVLGANKRVLMIGAHPDDEDNELLTLLSRGYGAQTAYLSLTRGEGGQNLIGPELGPELGVLRTEELLAARQLDGARQFFTRAYDFGFSKTAEESFRFWPRDSLLRDVLDVVRRFRPQVIVSVFSGTPRDGHGQHQVAGILARQAFEMLKDSSWGPVKLYRSARFDTAGATLTLEGGRLDVVAGRSFRQLAADSRGRHRSQGEGQIERLGPSPDRLALLETRGGASATPGQDRLFAGVDTLLPGAARYTALLDSARAALRAADPGAIVPLLARASAALGRRADLAGAEQRPILDRALATAAGVMLDGISDDGVVVGGERVAIEATLWNAGGSAVRLDTLRLVTPPGWVVEAGDLPVGTIAPGTMVTGRYVITPAESTAAEPYFLRRPLMGWLYDWSSLPADVRGTPFEPPLVQLEARLTVGGAAVALSREVTFRYRDEVAGEMRRPVFADCPFDVALTPGLVVWPSDGAASGPRRFTVTVTNRRRGAAQADLALTVPPGWAPVPAQTLRFAREDESQTVPFTLALPRGAAPGALELRATAGAAGGARCGTALAILDYPHIHARAVVRAATAQIRVAKIALPPLARVGYVRGAADRVPEALAAVGMPVQLVDDDSLARGNLSRYDALVIGSRAYETDPALVAHNSRVLDYARGGGLVIVQYQQYPFIQGGLAPFPLSIARPHDRVTDEDAAVTVLEPGAPLFHTPNEIGPADWQGWVQDRGLYFAHDWDPAYAPQVELHDPGEPPARGGLLVARVGRGIYVYTGLAFFRQLPAGVPGAYRLFANLLALRGANGR